MNETYMYHGSLRVRVLQTNEVTALVQVGGNPPYNVPKKALTPDIPAVAELRKSKRLTVEVKRLILVNGKPIEDFRLDSLYEMIHEECGALESLQLISPRPNALINEIAERNKVLRELIEAINEVYP